MLIIGDDTPFPPTNDLRCGTLRRDYNRVPYGSLEFAPSMAVTTIPMSEWPDRIADLERQKATLQHVWADAGIGVWNQGQVGYCHAFSAVMAVAVQRAMMGLPFKSLSASSVGGPVTGWRNAGAYIHDDLKQMVSYGVSTTDFVPMLTTRLSDAKPGWREDAMKNRVVEFFDVPPRDFRVHGSLLLQLIPVSVGLNYWGHAVADLVLRDVYPAKAATDMERYGVEFLNSWGDNWGEKGWAVRVGSRKLADAIYAVRQSSIGV